MKYVVMLCLILMLALPVCATEFTAPAVPDSAEKYMPEHRESLSEGIWELLEKAVELLEPSVMDAVGICLSLIAITLALGFAEKISNMSGQIMNVVGALLVGVVLLRQNNSFISLGADTVKSLSEYCNLLLPVMSGALAAQGAVNSSAALYAHCYTYIPYLLLRTMQQVTDCFQMDANF